MIVSISPRSISISPRPERSRHSRRHLAAAPHGEGTLRLLDFNSFTPLFRRGHEEMIDLKRSRFRKARLTIRHVAHPHRSEGDPGIARRTSEELREGPTRYLLVFQMSVPSFHSGPALCHTTRTIDRTRLYG